MFFILGKFMQIFIMRHGQANPMGVSDAQRKLTEQGELEVAVMAKWLSSEQPEFCQVLASPFERAQQTANLMMTSINSSSALTTLDFITPAGSARQVHDYIDGVCVAERCDALLIVSHMPLVSYLVAELTVEQNAPIFQTAAIAEIDYDTKRMKGHLTRLISPNDLC
jgi:phosphohistidine phosphatase